MNDHAGQFFFPAWVFVCIKIQLRQDFDTMIEALASFSLSTACSEETPAISLP
jgi:hypothetical protein